MEQTDQERKVGTADLDSYKESWGGSETVEEKLGGKGALK